MFARAVIAVILASAPCVAQKKGAPIYKLPQKTVVMEDLKIATPAQPCTNYAVAVAIEAMLKLQQVPLDQHFWVQRLNGGELCVDALPDLDRLTRLVAGAYTLDDGRKINLEVQAIAGSPTSPDQAIGPLSKNLPMLLFWKSRAFVLRGIVYDEYFYPNGQRMYQIRELKMFDPLASAKEREVSFVNGTDDPAEITGLVFVSAAAAPSLPWIRQ